MCGREGERREAYRRGVFPSPPLDDGTDRSLPARVPGITPKIFAGLLLTVRKFGRSERPVNNIAWPELSGG